MTVSSAAGGHPRCTADPRRWGSEAENQHSGNLILLGQALSHETSGLSCPIKPFVR
jgi:hypothetical protein